MAAGCQKYICNSSRSACTLTKEAFHMLKKNTRKRLLAGALATVMMLTMCPSWALADDEDIALLPANEEIAVPVVDSTPAADPTETPAVPTPSETEAKPAEDQNTAPAPSEGGANGGTDSTESGNNNASSDVSEDNSQNNDVVSNSPENEISTASLDVDAYSLNNVKKIEAEYWITNRRAVADGTSTLEIASNLEGITDTDGLAITDIVPNERDATTTDGSYHTVFWQARVQHILHQGTGSNDDKTQFGTEITRIRYTNGKHGWDGKFEYLAKGSDEWTKFALATDHLVFYYLIRTEYSQIVQIDVSDWTVDKEDTQYRDRRSVTYQVYVEDGNEDGTDEPVASRTFWYNKAFKVSSVRVREIGNDPNYSIDRVVLDPLALGTVTDENGEYRFSLDLRETKHNATVKIYVKPNVQQVQLDYKLNGGEITSAKGTYTDAGSVWPDETITTPTVEKTDCVFDGWYTDAEFNNPWTDTTMPNENLTLYAKWTTNSTPVDPEATTPAKYFVLLPNRGEPQSGASQGWTNYLPNETSDGGVMGATREKGYEGSLTAAGKEAADRGEFNVNGVNSNYLVQPTDLGFFTAANWNGTTYPNYPADKTLTSAADITALLGTNYNPLIAQVVWYTVKFDSTDGYHVDGYVKNVDVNVTYHSNFGTDVTEARTAKTGEVYNTVSYDELTELPSRPNYEFTGWYTDKECKQPYSPTLLMSSMDLYAGWKQTAFDVSYFYKDAQNVETQFGTTETYKVKSDVTVRTAHPEKEGYTFTGWTNIANIVTVDANGQFKMPAENVRFDATFEINKYNVTYKVDDKEVGTDVYDFNSDVVIRPVPTKEGYTFTGWKIGTADAENFKMPAHDVTLEGTFAINRYTVTYKVDTEVVGTDVYDFNSDVVIRDVPTKEGYTFSGWKIGNADAENFKMPAHDVTIEGTFAKNSSGGSSGGHHRRPTVTIPDDVPTGLNGDDHYAYIVGYPDKTVRPQNGITRAEVATIFFRLLTDETRDANSTKSNSYSDVAAGAWYNHAVSTLSAMGIVKGDSHGKFNPNAPITRAEFAAIAARFDDKANTTTADFSDIASHWAKNEISAASNNGWITGYPDGTFRPDNKITRAEAMTLVNRVLKRLPETEEDLHDDMIKWSDNSDVSQWFYLDVQEATNSHYYQTKENQFEKWTKLRETRDWTELEK